MIFTKNQEVYFLALKCKTTPVPAKSAGTCTKFKKYLNKKRADMCILGCLLFMWGVIPGFRYRVSVAASQKTLFWHSKNGKGTFCGMIQKSASAAFLSIPRATRVSDMALFQQTMP
jgi:hypothetical protein